MTMNIQDYMGRMEKQLQHQLQRETSISSIKEVFTFYSTCMEQLVATLETQEELKEVKDVTERIMRGVTLLVGVLVKHHTHEGKKQAKEIRERDLMVSNLHDELIYQQNDLDFFNEITPQLKNLVKLYIEKGDVEKVVGEQSEVPQIYLAKVNAMR